MARYPDGSGGRLPFSGTCTKQVRPTYSYLPGCLRCLIGPVTPGTSPATGPHKVPRGTPNNTSHHFRDLSASHHNPLHPRVDFIFFFSRGSILSSPLTHTSHTLPPSIQTPPRLQNSLSHSFIHGCLPLPQGIHYRPRPNPPTLFKTTSIPPILALVCLPRIFTIYICDLTTSTQEFNLLDDSLDDFDNH